MEILVTPENYEQDVTVPSTLAYKAAQDLFEETKQFPDFITFFNKVLELKREFQLPEAPTDTTPTFDKAKLKFDWERFVSSHTITELAQAMNVSYNTGLKYTYLELPPKGFTVPEGFIPSAWPKRKYRMSIQRSKNSDSILRIEYGTKIGRLRKPINISTASLFYSDMSEEARRSQEAILLKAFEYTLAARLTPFGLHDLEIAPFPERLFLFKILNLPETADKNTMEGSLAANVAAYSHLFPLYKPKQERTLVAVSFRNGDQPISVLEARMREFFASDFEEICARLCLRHPDSLLAMFYCENSPMKLINAKLKLEAHSKAFFDKIKADQKEKQIRTVYGDKIPSGWEEKL